MPLSPGTSDLEPGSLAALIFETLGEEFGDEFGQPPEPARPAWTGLSSAIARAVVGHLLANAEITITIGPTDGGLQRYDAGDGVVATIGPSSSRTLTGVLS